MFCGNCGTKVDDGALFCPNCGSKIGEAAAHAVEQVAEPVQETMTKAVEQVAEPVQETMTKAVEQVAEPVQETVTQAVEQVAEPVQETVTQAAQQVAEPIQEPTIPPLPEMPQVNGIQEPAADNVPPVPPVQPEFNVRPGQQPMQAQEFPEVPADTAAPVTPIKKKKGKAGVIAGVTAAAVVVGGAGVGYFGFHDKITRTVMGDVAYARMINKNASASVTDSEAYKKTTKLGITAFADTALAARVYDATGDESARTASYQSIIKNIGLSGGGSYKEMFDNSMSAVPEGYIVGSSSTLNVEPGSVFALLSDGQIGELIKKIKDLSFNTKIANGYTDMFSLGLSDKDGNIGTAEVYADEYGDIILALPGITDKTVRIKQSDIEELMKKAAPEGVEAPDIAPAVRFSETEAERIRTDITDLYYKAYENAAISYSDITVTIGEGEWLTEAKGSDVSVTFTAEQLKALIQSVEDYLKNDAYLIGYAKERFGLSEADYRGMFKEPADMKVSLTVEQIVDVHNNVLGSKASISSTENSEKAELVNIGDEKKSASQVIITDKDGKKVTVKAFDRSENGSDGTALIQIGIEKTDSDLSLKTEYTGKGKAKWLDNEVEVGTFTVTLADPDKFIESLKKLSDSGLELPGANSIAGLMSVSQDSSDGLFGIDSERLMAELKKLEITLSTKVDEHSRTMTGMFSISAGEIGKVTATSTTVAESGTVSVPDNSNEVDIKDDRAGDELSAEVFQWIGGAAERLGLGDLGSMLGSFGSIGGTGGFGGNDDDEIYKAHYANYESFESGYYADDCAEMIFNGLNDTVANAMTAKGSNITSGVIKLYYDDGKLEVLDDAGISGITYTDSSLDSVYAEVIFDSRLGAGIAGVTAVLTDDKNDLPFKAMPDALNYYDQMYQWDGYGDAIGEYPAGSYPTLYTGDPYSDGLPEEKIPVSALNDAAEEIARNISSHLGSSNRLNIAPMGEEAVIQIAVDEYSAYVLYSEYTAIDDNLGDELAAVVEDACDIKNVYVGLYFCDNVFVGAAVLPNDGSAATFLTMDTMPAANDFKDGSFSGWYGTSESDYEEIPGYIYNTDYDSVRVGTYSLSAGSELANPDSGSGAAAPTIADDGSMTWKVTDYQGDFLVGDADPTAVDMYVTIFPDDKILELGVTEGSFVGRYHIAPIAFSSDSYMLFNTPEEAEEYERYETDDTAVGAFYTYEDTVLLMFINEEERYAMYALSSEGGDGSEEPISPEFGEIKQDADIADIASEWTAYFNGVTVRLLISSNGIASTSTNDEGYYAINPRDGGFDVYEGIDTSEITGEILYSEETNSIKVVDFIAGEEAIFVRTETAPAYSFEGDWELESVNDIPMTDFADRLGRTVEEITTYMSVSEYDIILTNADGVQVLLIGAFPEGYYVRNPGENFAELGTYDEASDTLTVVSTEFESGSSTEAKETTVLIFKRQQSR